MVTLMNENLLRHTTKFNFSPYLSFIPTPLFFLSLSYYFPPNPSILLGYDSFILEENHNSATNSWTSHSPSSDDISILPFKQKILTTIRTIHIYLLYFLYFRGLRVCLVCIFIFCFHFLKTVFIFKRLEF